VFGEQHLLRDKANFVSRQGISLLRVAMRNQRVLLAGLIKALRYFHDHHSQDIDALPLGNDVVLCNAYVWP
jgi:hypothetical protein